MSSRYHTIAALGLTVVLTAMVCCCYLGGWSFLNSRPIVFDGDGVFFYSYAKVVAQSGWNWSSATMGAPFHYPLIAFAQNLTFDTLLLRILSLTTDSPIALLNRCWLVGVCTAAATCFLAFRLMGIRNIFAVVTSVMFAVIPYAFFRNVSHFNLLYYTIPLPTLLVFYLLAGRLGILSRARYWILTGTITALGFSYIYNSFFASYLLAAGTVLALLRRCEFLSVRRATLALAILVLLTAINLAPSIVEWHRNGQPENMEYKAIQEADVYALRLRDVVLPHANSPIPFLSAIGLRSIAVPWPNENESQTAKIGTVPTLGLVILLLCLLGVDFFPSSPTYCYRRTAAVLLLLLLLLSVPGGFGSLFNFFISPNIRAYNRIVPFVALCSLYGLASVLQDLSDRYNWGKYRALVVAAPLLAFALLDQDVARPLRQQAADFQSQAQELKSFISTVESRIPPESQFYMLPSTIFPPDPGLHRMRPYDHAKPILFSKTLRWSWPNFGLANSTWTRSLGPSIDAGFINRLRLAGFAYIWIDRFGYLDGGAATVRSLDSAGAAMVATGVNGRYTIYSIQNGGLASQQHSFEPVVEQFSEGFYQEEHTAEGTSFRWATQRAKITLRNTRDRVRHLRISFALQGFSAGNDVRLEFGDRSWNFPLSNPASTYTVSLAIPSHGRIDLVFTTDAKRPDDLKDPRNLRYALHQFSVNDIDAGKSE